jgi:hypothetical protein
MAWLMTFVLTAVMVGATVTATAEVVETKEGRTILLKEDGTYEVIRPEREGLWTRASRPTIGPRRRALPPSAELALTGPRVIRPSTV